MGMRLNSQKETKEGQCSTLLSSLNASIRPSRVVKNKFHATGVTAHIPGSSRKIDHHRLLLGDTGAIAAWLKESCCPVAVNDGHLNRINCGDSLCSAMFCAQAGSILRRAALFLAPRPFGGGLNDTLLARLRQVLSSSLIGLQVPPISRI